MAQAWNKIIDMAQAWHENSGAFLICLALIVGFLLGIFKENRKLKDEIENMPFTNERFENRNQDVMNQQVQNNEELHLETVSFSEEFIPQLYAITPTYKRPTQKLDLTSVIQAMRLSNVRIQMILVEDTNESVNDDRLLHLADRWNSEEPSNIRIQLLIQNTVRTNNNHRGVFQRNAGLNWVMKNYKNTSAAVYLADDDNTYIAF